MPQPSITIQVGQVAPLTDIAVTNADGSPAQNVQFGMNFVTGTSGGLAFTGTSPTGGGTPTGIKGVTPGNYTYRLTATDAGGTIESTGIAGDPASAVNSITVLGPPTSFTYTVSQP